MDNYYLNLKQMSIVYFLQYVVYKDSSRIISQVPWYNLPVYYASSTVHMSQVLVVRHHNSCRCVYMCVSREANVKGLSMSC